MTNQHHSTANMVTGNRWPAHGFGDRFMGDVELTAKHEAALYIKASLSEEPSPLSEATAYDTWAISKILENIEAEIARRERLFAAGHDVADIRQAQHDAWLALRDQVVERGSVFDILCRIGHAPGGPYSRSKRGEDEYHGSCPFCPDRGIDRFISWHSETGRDWFHCRQCKSSGDIITLVEETVPGCGSFYRAIAYLANDLALPLPEPPKLTVKSKARRKKPKTAFIGGKMVVLDA